MSFFNHFTLIKCCSNHVLHKNYIGRKLAFANLRELLRGSMPCFLMNKYIPVLKKLTGIKMPRLRISYVLWCFFCVCVCVEPIKLLLCPLRLRSVSHRGEREKPQPHWELHHTHRWDVQTCKLLRVKKVKVLLSGGWQKLYQWYPWYQSWEHCLCTLSLLKMFLNNSP